MANDINQVTLVGRLTRDAELKYTGGGTAVCKFSIALNRSRKNGDQWQEEAHFFDIVVWGRQGEAIHQYLTKGKQIAVQGELRQNRWEKDGQQRSKVEITAQNVQLLGGPSGNRNEAPASSYNSRPDTQHGPNENSNNFSGGPEQFEDDIPF
ncbi:MAG: single-stranded DNA-binding protein [Spirochaetaceae bacterium]|nr:single-stranded DNA-binding protein [Spirochaetaceae bacterium]MCF7947493.1 single-stranded DNA-binding protein [Spirochaetia bacterium]MCF7950599.1 single-stranded DNA-binding protein [Spirochaetaceae bacterium]